MTLLIYLLLANAVAHLISFRLLSKSKESNRFGVLAFSIINLVLALLLWQHIPWVKWLVLLFPLIGGLTLLFTVILKKKGIGIDYLILLLDLAIIFSISTKQIL